jgi:hypothetical protein
MLNDGVVFKTRGEIGQVEKDDRIFIQVLLKSRVGGYFKVGKQMARVARLVVIGIEHLGRHRLAKTTASGYAAETSFCEKRTVDYGNKPRLVNIFTVSSTLKSGIAYIDICSHVCLDFDAKVGII